MYAGTGHAAGRSAFLLARQALGDYAPTTASPIIADGAGALWFVVADKHGAAYLAHTGHGGAITGNRHFPLPKSVVDWNVFWLDAAHRRVIVGNYDGDHVGFDLSGHRIWTIATFINSAPYEFGTGHIYLSSVGWLDHGFFQALGTDKYDANHFTWNSAALLLVTMH